MANYYGDDTDLGDRFDADQQMAELERVGRRWASTEWLITHLARDHGFSNGTISMLSAANIAAAHRAEHADGTTPEHFTHSPIVQRATWSK